MQNTFRCYKCGAFPLADVALIWSHDHMIKSSCPDLVVICLSLLIYLLCLRLFELTIVFEKPGSMEAANKRKHERYSSLCSDIIDAGFICKNIPFEVGSRGHLSLENKLRLAIMHKICKPETTFTKFWKKILKTSLLCSYSIYLSRNDTWTGASFLNPS